MKKMTSLLLCMLLVSCIPMPALADTAQPASVIYAVHSNNEIIEDSEEEYFIEYDGQGRILKADSIIYGDWERYTRPELIYSVITPGIDEYSYDEAGNISSVTRYNEEGELRFRVLYRYDEQGRLSREIYTSGDERVIANYTYNEETGLAESVVRHKSTHDVTIKFSYSGSGKLKGLRLKEEIGAMSGSWYSEIGYDGDGMKNILVSAPNLLDEGTYFEFTYDESGRMETVKFTQGYFGSDYTLTYKY